jgi:hypothetical protein
LLLERLCRLSPTEKCLRKLVGPLQIDRS